ncbi:MAG TPA: MFS transporter [Candidatus Parabacteroides intestinipullorum]|uniref:MFS transporter n=1 Tax=Candidatus Parabacteroides intestinipullorum TaxID=2838723 RepID=A0A9D2BG36_9BACT|nr:MFS transporter [Candidatus Parabacteroides intestinipullorum]
MTRFPQNYPFYDWVPKPVGILILILLFIPILTVGGVYSANSGEMMSGLGILSEHIQFVGFVTSIGMAAFAPFFYDLVRIRREKLMCLVGFSIMYLLSYVCAVTESIFLLALCSLIMGFLRMVLMMVNLFTLIKYAFGMEATRNITPGNEPSDEEGWDRLDREKSTSMPIIYLFFMILGQVGTALTAWLAYEYEWQYVYYFMMGTILLSILIIFITMPFHSYPGERFPITFSKFGNVVVFSCMVTCFIYILVYGKTLDWFDDPTIVRAALLTLLFGAIFIYLESSRRSPFFLMDLFKLRTINMGVILFLLLMILNSSAMFVNVFTSIGMKIDNWQNAALGNWCVVGYIIGAILSIALGSRSVHLKYLFAIGFLLLGCSALFIYFEVQSAGLYDRMKYPVIIRAAGMMIIYSLTAVHANQRMPYKYLSTWICVMLTVRMVIGPGIGTAIYTNLLQERQQHYVTRYAQNVDRMNPDAEASYTQTARGMRYQGKSETEAEQMASISTKGRIQAQATLSAVKEMSGWTFYGCLAAMLFVLAYPYRKRKLLT